MRPRTWITVGLAGAAAGTLDLCAALLNWVPRGVTAQQVLQSIASGLLGREAFAGGAGTAALGLGLHFLIATGVAGAFVGGSRMLPKLLERPWLVGGLYGVGVWAFMRFVVLPLSAARPGKLDTSTVAIAVVTHVICVRLPVTWIVRRRGAGHSGRFLISPKSGTLPAMQRALLALGIAVGLGFGCRFDYGAPGPGPDAGEDAGLDDDAATDAGDAGSEAGTNAYCLGGSQQCAAGERCCFGDCDGGFCPMPHPPCSMSGERCDVAADCCYVLSECDAGLCGNAPAQCRQPGQSCAAEAPCCREGTEEICLEEATGLGCDGGACTCAYLLP